MKNLLVINASLNGEAGNSSKLVNSFVEKVQAAQQVNLVVERHLSQQPLPHLSAEEMQAWMTAADARSEQQQTLAAISDTVIAEVKSADVIVVGMPMYNFGVPSTFKAWVDRLARAGVTFKYTETGPVGLLADKKVYVLAARGGMYAGTEKDSQTQYLKDFFAFVGLTDVEFVYAEGLAMGEASFNSAWQSATQKINEKVLELNAQ